MAEKEGGEEEERKASLSSSSRSSSPEQRERGSPPRKRIRIDDVSEESRKSAACVVCHEVARPPAKGCPGQGSCLMCNSCAERIVGDAREKGKDPLCPCCRTPLLPLVRLKYLDELVHDWPEKCTYKCGTEGLTVATIEDHERNCLFRDDHRCRYVHYGCDFRGTKQAVEEHAKHCMRSVIRESMKMLKRSESRFKETLDLQRTRIEAMEELVPFLKDVVSARAEPGGRRALFPNFVKKTEVAWTAEAQYSELPLEVSLLLVAEKLVNGRKGGTDNYGWALRVQHREVKYYTIELTATVLITVNGGTLDKPVHGVAAFANLDCDYSDKLRVSALRFGGKTPEPSLSLSAQITFRKFQVSVNCVSGQTDK